MSKGWRNAHLRQGYVSRIARLADRLLAGSPRGEQQEQRLVKILSQYLEHDTDVPPWLHRIALGTHEQDHQGIDVVATTDVGPLFIQVKSSEIFKRHFEAEHQRHVDRGKRVPILDVIVVNDHLTDAQVLGQTLGILRRLRQQVERHGSFLPAKRQKSR